MGPKKPTVPAVPNVPQVASSGIGLGRIEPVEHDELTNDPAMGSRKKCESTSNVITNVLEHNILNSKRVRRPVIKFSPHPTTSQAPLVELSQHTYSAETITMECPSEKVRKLSSCELASGSHAAIEPEIAECVQVEAPRTPEQSQKRKKNTKESTQLHKKRKLHSSLQLHEKLCQEGVQSLPGNMPVSITASVQNKRQSSIDQHPHPEYQEVVSKIHPIEDQSASVKHKMKIKKPALLNLKKIIVRSLDCKMTPAKKKRNSVLQQPPDEHSPSESTFQTQVEQSALEVENSTPAKITRKENRSVQTKNKMKTKKTAFQNSKKISIQSRDNKTKRAKQKRRPMFQQHPDEDSPSEPIMQTPVEKNASKVKSMTPVKKIRKPVFQQRPDEDRPSEPIMQTPVEKSTSEVKSTTPGKKKRQSEFQQIPDEHSPSEPILQTPVEKSTSEVKSTIPAKKKRKPVFQQRPDKDSPSEPILQTSVEKSTSEVKRTTLAKKKSKPVFQQRPDKDSPSEPILQTSVEKSTSEVKRTTLAKKKRKPVFQQRLDEDSPSQPILQTLFEKSTSEVKSTTTAKKKRKSVAQQFSDEHSPSEPIIQTPVGKSGSEVKSNTSAKKRQNSVLQVPSIDQLFVSSEFKGSPPKHETVPEPSKKINQTRKPSSSKTEFKKLPKTVNNFKKKNQFRSILDNDTSAVEKQGPSKSATTSKALMGEGINKKTVTVKKSTKWRNPNPATIITLKVKPYADWSTAVQEVPAVPAITHTVEKSTKKRPKLSTKPAAIQPPPQHFANKSNGKQNAKPAVGVLQSVSPKKADECSDVTSVSTSTSWAIVSTTARSASGVLTHTLDGKIPTVRLTRLKDRKEHPSTKSSKLAEVPKTLASSSESSSSSSSSSSDSSSSDTSLDVVERTPNSSEKYSDMLNFPALQLSECSDNTNRSFPDLMREILGMIMANNNFNILSSGETYSNSNSKPHVESSKVSTSSNKIRYDVLTKSFATKPNFKISFVNDLRKNFSTKLDSNISFDNKNRASDLPNSVTTEPNSKTLFSNTNKSIASVIEKLSDGSVQQETQQSHLIKSNMKATVQANTKVQFKDIQKSVSNKNSSNATVTSVPIEVEKNQTNETTNSSSTENSAQKTLTASSVVKPALSFQATEDRSHFTQPQMPKTVPADSKNVEASVPVNEKSRKSDIDEDAISLYAESIESYQCNRRQRHKFMCERKNADSTSGPNDIDKPVAPAPSPSPPPIPAVPSPPPVPAVRCPPAAAAALDDVSSESEHSDDDRAPPIVLPTNVKFMFCDPGFTRSTLFSNICIHNLLNNCNTGRCRQRHATLEQHLLRVKELHNNCNRRTCIAEYLNMKNLLTNTHLFNDYAQLFMDCFIAKNKVRFLLEVVIDYYRTGTYLAAMDRALAGISDVAALEKCIDLLAYRLEDGRLFVHVLLKAISRSRSNHTHVCIKLLSIAGRLTESVDINTALLLVKKACEAPLNLALVRATFSYVVCKTSPVILGHKKVIEDFANVLKSLNLKISKRLTEMVENCKTQAGDRQNDSEPERQRTDLPECFSGKERNVWSRGESNNAMGCRPQAPGLMSVNALRNNGPEHRFRISPDTTQYPTYPLNPPIVPSLMRMGPIVPRPRHQFRPLWTPPRMWFNSPRHRFHQNSRY